MLCPDWSPTPLPPNQRTVLSHSETVSLNQPNAPFPNQPIPGTFCLADSAPDHSPHTLKPITEWRKKGLWVPILLCMAVPMEGLKRVEDLEKLGLQPNIQPHPFKLDV